MSLIPTRMVHGAAPDLALSPGLVSSVGEVGAPMQETDINFWARQFSEHCLFFHLGLDDARFKNPAKQLHDEWEAARPALDLNTALALAQKTRAFKTEILTTLNSGQWLGWIFPTFVDHTRRELDLFVANACGAPVTATQTATEWLRFMAEHAAFAAHLMDPVEAMRIRQALAAVGKLSKLQAACRAGVTDTLLGLSNTAGTELDTFVVRDVSKAKSIIHPVLATHVVREGRRFLYTIARLRGQR